MRRALVPFLVVFLNNVAHAEGAQFPKSMPSPLIECEGTRPCTGVWTFDGVHGKAEWPSEATYAELTVVRFSPEQIVIDRTDTSKADFTAVYVGKLEGNTISGTVTWTWPSVWSSPVHGVWHATLQSSASAQQAASGSESQQQPVTVSASQRHEFVATYPPLLTSFEVAPRRDFFNLNGVWQPNLQNSAGSIVPPLRVRQQAHHVQITLDVHEAMSRNSSPDPKDTVVFDGTYKQQHVVGRGLAHSSPKTPPGRARWYQDSYNVTGPDQFTLDGVTMTRISPVGPHDAVCDNENSSRLGLPSVQLRASASALTYHDYKTAACWVRAAANDGDARSATVLAVMYLQGRGVPKNDEQAFRWANIGGSRGDYLATAILSQMYAKGVGTPVDKAQAHMALIASENQQLSATVTPELIQNLIAQGAGSVFNYLMTAKTCYMKDSFGIEHEVVEHDSSDCDPGSE
jgi:hypothetical protein